MREQMLTKTAFAMTALLASMASLAAAPMGPIGPNAVIFTRDGLAIATRPSVVHTPQVPVLEPGLTKIFNNLSRYPDGAYWCCTSLIISGPNSQIGSLSWIAAPFTANADITVSRIVLGLGHVTGKNAVVVTLNSDSGGLPGTELASTTVSNLPAFPSCCVVAQAKGQGVTLSTGQQYWVVVKTNSGDSDTLAGWNFNDTEQVVEGSEAINTGTGWQPLKSLVAPAFQVLGK
jgi:hypothetical protein